MLPLSKRTGVDTHHAGPEVARVLGLPLNPRASAAASPSAGLPNPVGLLCNNCTTAAACRAAAAASSMGQSARAAGSADEARRGLGLLKNLHLLTVPAATRRACVHPLCQVLAQQPAAFPDCSMDGTALTSMPNVNPAV